MILKTIILFMFILTVVLMVMVFLFRKNPTIKACKYFYIFKYIILVIILFWILNYILCNIDNIWYNILIKLYENVL